MQLVDKKNLKSIFNKNIYEIELPIFITSDIFWDGGIDSTFSLREKAQFYSLAFTMSNVLKQFISILNEDIYIGDFLCEYKKMYAKWSDLKKVELFRIVSKIFKKNQCYKLSLTDDSKIIDLIIESNFKYYTYFSFFLPNSNIIIQPTCHTELIVYSENAEYFKGVFVEIVKSYNNIKIK